MYVISLRLKKDTWDTNNLWMKCRNIHVMNVITLGPEKKTYRAHKQSLHEEKNIHLKNVISFQL